MSEIMKEVTGQEIVAALRAVLDPEVGINVVDLGLVYGIKVSGRDMRVIMTMTSQACPLNSYFRQAVETAIRKYIPEAMEVDIEMIWQPEWSSAMMSEEARRLMGWRA